MDIKELNLKEKFFNDFSYEIIKDDLTSLINRKYFIEYINYLIKNEIPFNLISFDIDKLKYFNNDHSYKTGDLLIHELINIISDNLPNDVVLGRLDGDEISIILKGELSYDEKWSMLRTVHQATRKPIKLLDKEYLVTLTSGLISYPENAKTTEDLLNSLDKAIYRGKSKGGNCYIIYSNIRHKDLGYKNDISTLDKINKIKSLFNDKKNKNIIDDSLMLIKELINVEGVALYLNSSFINKSNLIMNMKNMDIELVNELLHNGFIKINNISELESTEYLYEYLKSNNIKSCLLFNIELKKENGLLMVYSNHNKTWNENDIVLVQYLSDYVSLSKKI